jgi:hypothetical protein
MQHAMPQERIQEPLDLSSYNRMKIPHLKPGPGVFHSLIRMKEVVSNLRAEARHRFALILG